MAWYIFLKTMTNSAISRNCVAQRHLIRTVAESSQEFNFELSRQGRTLWHLHRFGFQFPKLALGIPILQRMDWQWRLLWDSFSSSYTFFTILQAIVPGKKSGSTKVNQVLHGLIFSTNLINLSPVTSLIFGACMRNFRKADLEDVLG